MLWHLVHTPCQNSDSTHPIYRLQSCKKKAGTCPASKLIASISPLLHFFFCICVGSYVTFASNFASGMSTLYSTLDRNR
jgi:hypothetical protein